MTSPLSSASNVSRKSDVRVSLALLSDDVEPLPVPFGSEVAALLGFRRTGIAPEEVSVQPAMGFLNMLALAQKHTQRR